MSGTSATLCVETPEARRTDDAARVAQDRARARLERHAAIWRMRPLTRDIYRRYHQTIDAARSTVPGADVEVGAGHGSFAEFRPGTVSCDIVPCPWLSCSADATRLPFADESLANIIMIDVLHHVARPIAFLKQTARVLAPGGRLILLEPYVSPVSSIAWRYFHDEHIDTHIDPLKERATAADAPEEDPWEANIAIPTLVFWRHLSTFRKRFPELRVIRRQRLDMIVMPLSGGFERRRLIPLFLIPVARALERVLAPLAPWLAFRCFLLIEKTSKH